MWSVLGERIVYNDKVTEDLILLEENQAPTEGVTLGFILYEDSQASSGM